MILTAVPLAILIWVSFARIDQEDCRAIAIVIAWMWVMWTVGLTA